jgi:hypothetical protein
MLKKNGENHSNLRNDNLLQLTYQPDLKVVRDRERKKQARREIRAWLAEYKRKGCQNCNERRTATLDFHHLDKKNKSIEINEAIKMRWSRKSIEREISKCILICANCHRCEHENSYRNSSVNGVYSFSDDEIYENFVYCAAGTRS